MKEYLNGKIKVLDNAMTYNHRRELYHFFTNSLFHMEGTSDRLLNTGNFFISNFSQADHVNSGFSEILKSDAPEIHELVNGKQLTKALVNCTTPFDTPSVHIHNRDTISLLYYPNMKWDPSWGGQTLFFDDKDENEIIYTSPYVPGRILYFEGDIPHASVPQTVNAHKYRITYALFFK